MDNASGASERFGAGADDAVGPWSYRTTVGRTAAGPSPATAPGTGVAPENATRGMVVYLGALVVAELATVRAGAGWGLLGQAVIVVVLLVIVAAGVFRDEAAGAFWSGAAATSFLVALLVPPVIQAITLTLPLEDRTPAWRILGTAGPGLIACLAAVRAAGFTRADIGLRLGCSRRGLIAAPAFVAAGAVLGFAVTRIDAPAAAVVPAGSGSSVVLPIAAALVIGAILQELVLRGLVLQAAARVMGQPRAVAASALLGAVVALGTGSLVVVVVALVWGLAAGAVASRTGSLVGVVVVQAVAAVVAGLGLPVLLGLQ